MPYRYNAITGEMDIVDTVTATGYIKQIDTDVGSALPVADIINLLGTAIQGISSSSVGNTVTLTIDNATATQKGVTELATDLEVIGGALTDYHVVNPSSLKAKLGSQTRYGIALGDSDSSAIEWSSALTNGQIIIGSNGSMPTAGVLTSTGGTVAITLGAGAVNLESGSTTATSVPTDSGTATPSAGVLTLAGGTNINTAGVGSTATTNLDDDIELNSVKATTFDTNVATAKVTISGTAIASSGTDANIDIPITAKGTGTVNPNALSVNSAYTFPTVDGTASQVQKTDGAGVVTWEDDGSGTGTTSVDTDVGTATPVGGVLTLGGGTNTNTEGSGSTAKVNLDADIELTSVKATTFDTNVASAGVTLAGTSLIADGTDANISIPITPKGTGSVNLPKVDVGAGEIDGTAIGANSASTGKFSTLNVNGAYSFPTADGTADQVQKTDGSGVVTWEDGGAGGLTWTVVTADASFTGDTGTIANKAGLLTRILPATGVLGEVIRITGINTDLGWKIAQNANQQIHFGNNSTTSGVGGSLASANKRDSVELVCIVEGASSEYNVISSQGNITVT